MPDEIRAGNLPEDARSRLKYNRVREGHHASGRRVRRASSQFHHLHAHKADIDHFSRYAADLYAIAYPNSVAADQEEVADNGDNYVLQRDRDAGSEQSRVRHGGVQPARKTQSYDDGDRDSQGNFAQQQELIPAVRLVHVAKNGPLSDFSKDQDKSYEYSQNHQPCQQAFQDAFQIASHFAVPVFQ